MKTKYGEQTDKNVMAKLFNAILDKILNTKIKQTRMSETKFEIMVTTGRENQ